MSRKCRACGRPERVRDGVSDMLKESNYCTPCLKREAKAMAREDRDRWHRRLLEARWGGSATGQN